MFENADVAGHQRRGGKPKDLPERKIPRHDGEHDAHRLKGDPALAAFHTHGLVGKKFLGVLDIVIASGSALFRFRRCRLDRLAHLDRHQSAKLATFPVENPSGFAHACSAFGKGSPAML